LACLYNERNADCAKWRHFDPPSRPFKPEGEDYVETVHPLAPWRGYWELVSSLNGAPAPGVATMEPGVLPNGTRVLAVERDVNVRPLALTVYMLRKDAGGVADCDPACENDWVPLL
jgi:hypothetical protein